MGIPILVVTIGLTRVLAEHRRAYSGTLIGRSIPTPYLRRPSGSPVARIGALAVDPAVRRDMLWLAVDGTVVPVAAESLCVHGDSPGAVAMARAVRGALRAAGVTIAPFAGADGSLAR